MSERPQWFITADGTVIQTWPPGPDNDRLKYVRYGTTRRVDLTDLHALDERLTQFQGSFNRSSRMLLVLVVLWGVAVALVWIVPPLVGASSTVSGVLNGLLVLALLVLRPVARTVSGGSRRGLEQIYADAGLASAVPKVIKNREAEALIDAPGTVAG